MANVDDSNKLICALSFKKDKHLVQHAFKLSCNHFVCKRCLKTFSSCFTDNFRCEICEWSPKEANEQLEKLYPDKLKTLVKESNEKIASIESTQFF